MEKEFCWQSQPQEFLYWGMWQKILFSIAVERGQCSRRHFYHTLGVQSYRRFSKGQNSKMFFLLTNSHCCTPTCAGLLMAVTISPRKQQEAGQTPAEFHLSSSYSTLVTSLIQWVKAGEMLRERPHMLLYMCMNWKEQRPEGSGAECVPLHAHIGVLVGCWECRQDKLSRHLPLLRLPGLPVLQKACVLS